MTIDRLVDHGSRDFALAAVGACGLVAMLALAARPEVSSVKPIVNVAEPVAAASIVRVTMPEPPPPPEPAKVVYTPIEESTNVPQLRAQCMNDQSGDCTAQMGFPAISHDGKSILQFRYIDDSSRGYPGMRIELVDVATSKVKKTYPIASPDEWDEEAQKFNAPIAKRVGAVQKVIGDGEYRSLAALPFDRLVQDGESFEFHLDGLDYKTTISTTAEFPGMKYDPEEDMCGSVEIVNQSSAWFDAKTHLLVVDVLWSFGPSCHCGSDTRTYVRSVYP